MKAPCVAGQPIEQVVMEPRTGTPPIRILLVDDQAITGHLLKRMLADAPEMVVLTCTDPRTAVQMATEHDPAIILLDLVMPEMDGLTLLRQFRAMARFVHMPVILLSSLEQAETKAQAFQAGANDYLVKLPDAVEMLARLRYHVDNYFNRLQTQRAQQALMESEQRFRLVTQSISEAIIAVCPNGMVHFWNRGAEHIFGYTEQEMLERSIDLLIPSRLHVPYFRKFYRMHILGHRVRAGVPRSGPPDQTMELLGVRRDGEEFPMELSVATWQTEGEPFYAAVVRDVTERKRAEEKIRYQAHYDLLTDLPNRNLFLKRLDESLVLAERQKKRMALLFIDLDRFKWVNDTLGHDAGDELLQQAAWRMKQCVRRSDTVARLGGDEFTIILFDVAEVSSAVRVVDNLLQQLSTPFPLTRQEVTISGSVGVTFFPEDGTDRESLLRNADHAMYIAKRSGRNAYWLFTPEQADLTQ
ncbi:MAG: diguanylate cyclase [Magnetococcus sp. DMHC-8]